MIDSFCARACVRLILTTPTHRCGTVCLQTPAQTAIGSLVAVTFRFESAGGSFLFFLFSFFFQILQY